VKNFVTDFGAVADGTTDDSPAVDRWLAWAQAQGTAPVELYMPPGNYHFAGDNDLTYGLYNVTISGYGAIVDSLQIGTDLLHDDFDHSARIQTVSAGATSVDLVTPADASKFSVGQWVLVSGLELQGGAGGIGGFPPNFQFFEYKQIVNISGSVVTFASPLANSYESTWPVVDSLQGGSFNVGGPATIYALGPTFDAQQTILGLEVTANPNHNNGAVFMEAGLSLVLDGMKFDGLGPAPSVGQSVVIRNSYFGTSNEIDKVLSYLEYDNDTGQTLLVQSAAPETLVINHSAFNELVGTAQNTSIENSTIGLVMAGPNFFGVGESLSIINSSIATALESDLHINPSQVSFNNGTFSVATASPDAHSVYAWAVPGHEYFIAYYDGNIHATDDSGHVTTFKVLDVRQDATNIYVDTDLGATLPTPTFLTGRAANQYVAYPVMTVAETSSGPFVSLIHPPDTPPVVTVSQLIATHGLSFAASSLFTASDPDGDTITQYGLWDTGGGGGHFVLNGVAQGTNQEIDVSAAQLSQLSYQSGSGADTLWMRANDGTQWSAWSNPFTVTAPVDTGPVVTSVSNIKTTAGQTFAASSLFTASDPFGDAIAQYDFWDTGGGGGHFALNGQALGAKQENIVTAAQLAQTTYVSGSGTDTLWVRVNEGGQWSALSPSFTVSDPTTIGAGETLELTSDFPGEVSFAAPTGVLELFNSSSFAGTVAGMGGQDTIDLVDIDPTKVQTPSYSGDVSGGTLAVTDGSHTANIALLGNYLASTFVTSSDGHGGTSVINQPTTMTDQSVLVSPHHA
jgi:hypothetical protein